MSQIHFSLIPFVNHAVFHHEVMLWISMLLLGTLATTNGSSTWLSKFRKRIENNMTNFRSGFEFRTLCSTGIAAYSTLVGYWTCTNSSDCPSGHSCSPDEGNAGVCCPTQELCPDGCPISDTNGIKLCNDDNDCAQGVSCQKATDKPGVCCIDTSSCQNGPMQIEGLNPYPILKNCMGEKDCKNTHLCTRISSIEGICCPVAAEFLDTTKRLRTLLKRNEEKIRRRKNRKRDLRYLIPLIGTPFAIVLVSFVCHVKNEIKRYQRNREVDRWLSARKKKAREGTSAESGVSKFKHKGVLKIHGAVGDVKHALDNESSRSLKNVAFDEKHNEVVAIGSTVEQIDLSDSDEISERYAKESETSTDIRPDEKSSVITTKSESSTPVPSLEQKSFQTQTMSEKSVKKLPTNTGNGKSQIAPPSANQTPSVSLKSISLQSQSTKSQSDYPQSSAYPQTSSRVHTPRNTERTQSINVPGAQDRLLIPNEQAPASRQRTTSYTSEKINALMASQSLNDDSYRENNKDVQSTLQTAGGVSSRKASTAPKRS